MDTRFNLLQCFFQRDALKSVQALSPTERIFAYFMRNAAVAGSPIAVVQHSPHGLAIITKVRNVLAALHTRNSAS